MMRQKFALRQRTTAHHEEWHGRHPHLGPHAMREDMGGGPGHGRSSRGPHGNFDQGHSGRGGGGPGRARRGEARYILLEALRDGPKHGYEIIKTLEERSGGQYAPSPGTVYPTMQYLEDLGLVRSNAEGERRVYQLTEQGTEALESHRAEIAAFWDRYSLSANSPGLTREIEFLQQELADLSRTVLGGRYRPGVTASGSDSVRAVRAALEKCKNEVRDIISRGEASAAS